MTLAKKPVEGKALSPAESTLPAIDALGALNSVIDGALGYLRLREEQQTKRATIDAYATVEVARIHEASSFLKQYFEQVFAERSTTIEGLFRHLDVAMTSGDGTATEAALQGIVDLAKSSPLVDLGDLSQIRKAWDDPDHVWEL
ncbi:hypothetical protein [Blastococcus tunisiensis]|uniref:Uncharacterized protein n=1 Tax=Blastococcus tunisiensis TaxID=1798228 RepID=A0A1I2B6V9_9ACTN|nr:hypothetical protein [Blastococcus sp. DSM 46838]SFE51816.1 hypothetical protein SAMN05216574_10470 [Blastococcus sp. DSM 46838]